MVTARARCGAGKARKHPQLPPLPAAAWINKLEDTLTRLSNSLIKLPQQGRQVPMSSIIVCPVPGGSRLHTLAPDALVRTVKRDLGVGERHRRGAALNHGRACRADRLGDVPADDTVLHGHQLRVTVEVEDRQATVRVGRATGTH
jgi:hypothetical protein